MNFLDNMDYENHPISIFTKLYANEPSNLLYVKCLEQEINNAANELNTLEDSELDAFQFVVKMLSMSLDEKDTLSCVRMETLKKILDKVNRRRKK